MSNELLVLGTAIRFRGTFKLSVSGPGNIKAVTYLIDGEVIGQVSTEPFALSFNTDQYAAGFHNLSASIETVDGQTVTTAPRQFEFATAEQESSFMKGFLIPLFGGIAVLLVIIVGAQFLFFRKKSKVDLPMGAERNYGIAGGTICPRCKRPFALGLFSLNMGITSKLTRCPYCGRWGVFKHFSLDQLRAAEAAELADAQAEHPVQEKSQAEKLNELLDESRFTDKS